MNIEKLMHSIIFFVENTYYCNKIKTFKLLYLLDFIHYSEIGKSVTGLEYKAWDKGPVPDVLHDEIKKYSYHYTGGFFDEHIDIKVDEITKRVDFKPKVSFNENFFSNREMKIMKLIAEKLNTIKADDIIDFTHAENDPWDRVYRIENRRGEIIPYDYVINTDEELTQEIIDRKDFWGNIIDPR
ncbi:MAG: SocA family protein [Calditrichaeota bacterium]|nr:SocA family protein [Calditrichota bacterium]